MLRRLTSLVFLVFVTLAFCSLSSATVAAPVPSRVRILTDNDEAFRARWKLLLSATKSVHMQYYILDSGQYGLAILGQLLTMAKQGLDINVMVDGRGSRSLSTKDIRYLKVLAANGVKVTVYNPLTVTRISSIFGANHDKIFTVDGILSILGGRNLKDDYFSDAEDAFEDTDVVVESDRLAKELQKAFDREAQLDVNQRVEGDLSVAERTAAETVMLSARRAYNGTVQGQMAASDQLFSGAHVVAAEVLNTNSWLHTLKTNEIKAAALEAISKASTEIVLQNAYVVLSQDIIDALAEAAERGVKVILHTNSLSSSGGGSLPQWIFEAEWRMFSNRIKNLEIYTAGDSPRHLHAKVFVFDRETSIIGSYNLDQLSDKVNAEVAVKIDSKDVATRLVKRIEKQIAADSHRYGLKPVPDGDTSPAPGSGKAKRCALWNRIKQAIMTPAARFIRPLI